MTILDDETATIPVLAGGDAHRELRQRRVVLADGQHLVELDRIAGLLGCVEKLDLEGLADPDLMLLPAALDDCVHEWITSVETWRL